LLKNYLATFLTIFFFSQSHNVLIRTDDDSAITAVKLCDFGNDTHNNISYKVKS